MRHDMARVVTERPRAGHGNSSKKWGRRLNTNEFDLDDHGPNRAPIARRRQYSNSKEFSDLLGPLRRYLRKQVGRPWDKVWSDITQTLDSRSLTGQHIFDHIRWEVEHEAWIAEEWSPVPQAALGCHRVGRWALRPSRHAASLQQAEAVARIPRGSIPEGASGAPGVWHLGFDCRRYPAVPRRRPTCLGTPRRRLVRPHVPACARAARSRDHAQRWTRSPDLSPGALRARRHEAGEQEGDSTRRAAPGTRSPRRGLQVTVASAFDVLALTGQP